MCHAHYVIHEPRRLESSLGQQTVILIRLKSTTHFCQIFVRGLTVIVYYLYINRLQPIRYWICDHRSPNASADCLAEFNIKPFFRP